MSGGYLSGGYLSGGICPRIKADISCPSITAKACHSFRTECDYNQTVAKFLTLEKGDTKMMFNRTLKIMQIFSNYTGRF